MISVTVITRHTDRQEYQRQKLKSNIGPHCFFDNYNKHAFGLQQKTSWIPVRNETLKLSKLHNSCFYWIYFLVKKEILWMRAMGTVYRVDRWRDKFIIITKLFQNYSKGNFLFQKALFEMQLSLHIFSFFFVISYTADKNNVKNRWD